MRFDSTLSLLTINISIESLGFESNYEEIFSIVRVEYAHICCLYQRC